MVENRPTAVGTTRAFVLLNMLSNSKKQSSKPTEAGTYSVPIKAEQCLHSVHL